MQTYAAPVFYCPISDGTASASSFRSVYSQVGHLATLNHTSNLTTSTPREYSCRTSDTHTGHRSKIYGEISETMALEEWGKLAQYNPRSYINTSLRQTNILPKAYGASTTSIVCYGSLLIVLQRLWPEGNITYIDLSESQAVLDPHCSRSCSS